MSTATSHRLTVFGELVFCRTRTYAGRAHLGGCSFLLHRGALPVRPSSPCQHPVCTMVSGHGAAVRLVQKCSKKALFQDFQDSRKNTLFGLFLNWAGLIQAPPMTEN